MSKYLLMIALAAGFVAFAGSPAWAQTAESDHADAAVQEAAGMLGGKTPGLALIGLGLGVGLAVMGGARGIGNIGSSAVESIARQPEAGGRIFTSMLIAAALIEGFTFFALLIPFLASGNLFAWLNK